jgi:hypothetical protein
MGIDTYLRGCRSCALATAIVLGPGCHRPDQKAEPPVAYPEVPAPSKSGNNNLPERIVIVGETTADDVPEPEWRWGRAETPSADGRYPPIRSDWHDTPAAWELMAIDAVRTIPEALRPALERAGCTIPRYRYGGADASVLWGELERPGQRDVAILCVHPDHSSSTYVFWQADPSRMEAMPWSGSSIGTVKREDLVAVADPSRPTQPDMPGIVDHDAIDIGCCECCSTIFYRHNSKWFTLPGAD